MSSLPASSRLLLWLANLAPRLTGLDAIGESKNLVVSEYDLYIPNLHPAWENCRLAHVTDLHLHSDKPFPSLTSTLGYLEDRPVEIVAHTGDCWDTEPGQKAAKSYLSRLRGTLATVAIPGNWEYSSAPRDLVRPTYEASEITWLANDTLEVFIAEDAPPLCLAGLDSYREGRPDLSSVLPRLTHPTILLMHEPGPAALFPTMPSVQLILAGHTHGGQIRLPLLPPPVLPSFSRPFISGWYQTPAGPLYVSRGIGCHGSLRLCAPPELVIFTFKNRPAP